MGADVFFTKAKGTTAKEAFRSAVDQAAYDYGHAGYTGTIAEKHDFTIIKVPEGWEPRKYADHLINVGDPRIDDKWGPAGCIQLGPEEFLFFGWASS